MGPVQKKNGIVDHLSLKKYPADYSPLYVT